MASSLNKITTEIATSLRKELDEPFKRILAEKVDNWRSRLIRNSLQEKPLESKFFRQTIWVPLQMVNPIPDCVEGSDGAPVCDMLRSTVKLPTPLRYSTALFDYVGSVDGKNAFSEGAPGTEQYLLAGKYSRHSVYYSFPNGFLEIDERQRSIPMVRVDAVFDKPSEAMEFNCANSGQCDYWDEPYPVTGDILQMIIQSILQVDYNQPVVPSDKEVELKPQMQAHEPDGR